MNLAQPTAAIASPQPITCLSPNHPDIAVPSGVVRLSPRTHPCVGFLFRCYSDPMFWRGSPGGIQRTASPSSCRGRGHRTRHLRHYLPPDEVGPRYVGYGVESGRLSHQGRWPSDPNEKAVRACNADLVEPPFSMPENATWPDDKIVHPRRDSRYIWRSNEDTERIVGFWNPPFSLTSLGQVQFATPSFHDEIVFAAATTLEPQPLPEWYCGRQVVTRNDRECSDCRHLCHPTPLPLRRGDAVDRLCPQVGVTGRFRPDAYATARVGGGA